MGLHQNFTLNILRKIIYIKGVKWLTYDGVVVNLSLKCFQYIIFLIGLSMILLNSRIL